MAIKAACLLIGRRRYRELTAAYDNQLCCTFSRGSTGEVRPSVKIEKIRTVFQGEFGHAMELLSVLQKMADEDDKIKPSFTIRLSKVRRVLRTLQGH